MADPQLGYGQKNEVQIDQVNQWMRQTPWYQAQLRAWGQDPGHPTLTKSQSQQILKMAQGQGVVVDEGDMEVDNHGNFNPVGHKLRNTLIVGGIAAATLLTAGAAGAFSAAAAPSAAAATSASATAAGVGTGVGAGTLATVAGGAGIGKTLVDYGLKYALPVVGGIVGNKIQANASAASEAAQQKYLEEALAYQKEQDAFNRARQQGLDAQDVARYGYSTGVDASERGDSQQKYLAEFERGEDRYGYQTDLEKSRYGDYANRITPYLQTGASSNARMASLLGLAAPAPFDPALTPGPTRVRSTAPTLANPGTGFGGGPSPSQRKEIDPETAAAVDAELRTLNSSDSAAYWKEKLAAHGDSLTNNWQYWKDFMGRGDGVGKGYGGTA